MRRYVILLSAAVMQMCLGATYSWSVYVAPLKAVTGLGQGLVQLPFSVFYFAFPATMVLSGAWLPRLGPRRCAVAGGLIFGSGWLLAGLGTVHFAFTVAGIGLVAGVGVGLAYIVPIAVCIQWFPRQRGLVTGIAVAGFGGGAALVSQVGGLLLQGWGLTPFSVFRVLGLCFGLLVAGAGLSMRFAPEYEERGLPRLRLAEVLGRRGFAVLYVAMVAGLAAGFAVNANLKELAAGQTVGTGIAAVSLFALANAAGRIGWGFLFDRTGAAAVIRANLLAQAAALVLALWVLQGRHGLPVVAVLTGLNYGGVLVLYASATARIWGSQRVGQVYGLLFSANIPAALAPVLAGLSYDRTGGFTVSLGILAAALLAASLWVWRHAAALEGG
jgi:OFA family oxalate/formate antiporter-like MFS transporter